MNFFYEPDIAIYQTLSGDEAHHCLKVMRHQVNDPIGIFDGKGTIFKARITHIKGKVCSVSIESSEKIPAKNYRVHLAIAPTKSIDRMEWLVEKAGEIGVDEISFFISSHSERPKLNLDRLHKKAIGALKQSKSGYITHINPVIRFSELVHKFNSCDRYIAVVKKNLPHLFKQVQTGNDVLILVGPEGDFNQHEISEAIEEGVIPVSLGPTTLRTETAGLLACHMVNLVNQSA